MNVERNLAPDYAVGMNEFILHGKVVAAFVFFYFFFAGLSEYSDSEASVLPFDSEKPYINFATCLDSAEIATSGLNAVCTAIDGTKWSISQTSTDVLVPANELRRSPVLTAVKANPDSADHVTLKSPFIVMPEGTEQCDPGCAIAGQKTDGVYRFYPVSHSFFTDSLDNNRTLTGMDPLQAQISASKNS